MEIKTKYDIGQEVFIVHSSGLMSNYYKVVQRKITNINIGGKVWERYSVGSNNRAEKEIFTELKEAKKLALEKAKEHYEKNIEIINEQKLNYNNKL